ncbi:MAG: L-lactate permease [bacterium]
MTPSASPLALSALSWLLAFSPILALIVLMLGLGWGGKRAGPAGLAVALLIGWGRFGADSGVLAAALLRSLLLSAPVLYIIAPALILYHVAEAAGGIRNIGWTVSEMTKNHILQLMILAFGFTSFLQGVAGFGVPVAVVAPLLIGIGYPPVQAVAASLIGHAWAVGLGDMASSFQALLSVTGLPPHELGLSIALLLGFSGFATAVSLAHLHGGWSAVVRWPLIIALLGGLTALAQFALAWLDLWIVASFGAGMLCLLSGFILARFRRYQGPSRPSAFPPKPEAERVRPIAAHGGRRMSFHLAFAPYYALIAVVALATFLPLLHEGLHAWKIEVALSEIRTRLGVLTPARVWRLAPLGHPGALLLYTSLIGWLIYRANGRWPAGGAALFRKTFTDVYPTGVGILALTAMASVMTATGMIRILAEGASAVSGGVYPLIAPLVGLLGSFITGSNTNSNILFGAFQRDVAILVGKSSILVVGAQSAGGSLGSMVAPAKVLVGCATAGLGGREGEVFRKVAVYCLAQILLVGLLALWLAG